MKKRPLSDRAWTICILCVAYVNVRLSGFVAEPPSLIDVLVSHNTTKHVVDNPSTIDHDISRHLANIPTGWGNESLPEWVQALCPSVVEHYHQFPSFAHASQWWSPRQQAYVPIPYQTTVYAARAVCTYYLVHQWAVSLRTVPLLLHAGSHLGAVLHGQPIPWDNDMDAWMDVEHKAMFVQACQSPRTVYSNTVHLHCHADQGDRLKLWVEDRNNRKNKTTPADCRHHAPYLDLFFYQRNATHIWQVGNESQQVVFALLDYFPTMDYRMGGLVVEGAQAGIAAQRYDLNTCILGSWNHEYEQTWWSRPISLDCRVLKSKFPFRTIGAATTPKSAPS